MIDFNEAKNQLGLSCKGYPETPVTQSTYEQAVSDGVLRDWRDSNGDPASAPTWAALESAYQTASEANKRQGLVAYTWDLAVEKRRAITQPPEGVSDEALASYNQSLTGRAAAKTRRENQGRSKAGEETELQNLEAQADALETVDDAMLAITAEIQGALSGSLPTEEEIKNDSRWGG